MDWVVFLSKLFGMSGLYHKAVIALSLVGKPHFTIQVSFPAAFLDYQKGLQQISIKTNSPKSTGLSLPDRHFYNIMLVTNTCIFVIYVT